MDDATPPGHLAPFVVMITSLPHRGFHFCRVEVPIL